jgi:histidine triad (HIT) family protein
VVKGHVLVIPRAHYNPLTAVPDDTLHRLIGAVQAVARLQIAGLHADGVNVTQANGPVAGQVVPHVHFHVIPRFKGDGHSWNWRALAYRDASEMADYVERMRAAGGHEGRHDRGLRQDGEQT